LCVCVSQKEQKNWGRGKKRRGGEKLKKLKNHLRVLRERPPDVPAHGVVRVISGRERRRYQPVVLPRFCVLGGEGPVASVDGVEDALRERLRLFRLLRLFRPLVRRLCRGVPAALLPQPRRGRGRVKVAGALDHLPGVSRRRLVFHGERGSGSGSDGARRRGRRRCDVLFFRRRNSRSAPSSRSSRSFPSSSSTSSSSFPSRLEAAGEPSSPWAPLRAPSAPPPPPSPPSSSVPSPAEEGRRATTEPNRESSSRTATHIRERSSCSSSSKSSGPT